MSKTLWPHIEEQVQVRMYVSSDVGAGWIAGLERAHSGQALARDNLIPDSRALHADYFNFPPATMHDFNDVTVGRQRCIGRTADSGQINRRWMIDAVTHLWTLQGRVVGSEPERCHDVESTNRPGPWIHFAVLADLALAWSATTWRWFAEEVSGIEELYGLTV